MCVPIPPSAGTSATTQPTSAPIDYSRYAGVSPYDVRTRAFAGGLPTDWNWDEWMKVNPGAPDPRNHTSGGDPISPQNLALQNLSRTPVDARNFGPSAPVLGRPFGGSPPPGNTPLGTGPGTLPTPPMVGRPTSPTVPVTPTTPTAPTTPTTPTAPTTPTTVVDPGPSVAETPLTATPIASPTAVAHPVSGVYSGAGLQPDVTPSTRVANALARRFKPDAWY